MFCKCPRRVLDSWLQRHWNLDEGWGRAKHLLIFKVVGALLFILWVLSFLSMYFQPFHSALVILLTEAFAVVREAAKRKLGMRHFDVQVCLLPIFLASVSL